MLQQRLSQRQQPQSRAEQQPRSSNRSKEGAARSPPKGADDADARRNMLQERLSEKVQKKQSTVSNDSRPTSAREAAQRPAAKTKPQLNSEQLIQGSQRVPSRYESSTTAVSSHSVVISVPHCFTTLHCCSLYSTHSTRIKPEHTSFVCSRQRTPKSQPRNLKELFDRFSTEDLMGLAQFSKFARSYGLIPTVMDVKEMRVRDD